MTVQGYTPPSGTVQASPVEIWAGEKSTLSANFTAGQCGGTLRPPQFATSEGSISGNEFDSSGVQFDPSNTSEQRKTVRIAANVSDGTRVLLETLKTMTNGDQTKADGKKPGLDQKRALNAAAVISAGKGICSSFPASQIQVSAVGTDDNGVDYQPNFCAASAGAERPGQGVKESEAAKNRRVEV